MRRDIREQQFERFEREVCLRCLTLPEQTRPTGQVVEAVIAPASVDVSATYVAQQSVPASPSSNTNNCQK
jgi:hypothetical protein